MAKTGIINLSSLKDQVYEYLRHQMKIGEIRPDSVINMDLTSKKLGVSKTPLRDALLQLEMEGFVTILPRRGVIVNKLTLQDIKDYYQILGALESTAIIAVSESLKASDVKKMEKLNEGMNKAIERDNFDAFYERNLAFHDVYINQAGNRMLRRTVDILKKRLYDFPRRKGYIKEWEETSIKEHQQLVNLLAEGKFLDAANFLRDVHWSFKVQKKFIKKYYPLEEKNED
jgi:DNA-binding GntR family transcriptional regulator